MRLPANHAQAAFRQSSMAPNNNNCKNTSTDNSKPDSYDFFFAFNYISFVAHIKQGGIRFKIESPRRVLTNMSRKEFSCGQHLFIKT